MANEVGIFRKFYRVIDHIDENGIKYWKRFSFWNRAQDTECEDGITVETKIGNVKGFTTSDKVTEQGLLMDASTISNKFDEFNNSLTENTQKIDNINLLLNMRYNPSTDYIQVYRNDEWVDWRLAGFDFDGTLYFAGTFSNYWGDDFVTKGTRNSTSVNKSYINIGGSWSGESDAKNFTIFQTPVDVTNYETLRITAYSSYIGSWEKYSVGYSLQPTDTSFTKSKEVKSTGATVYTFDVSQLDTIYIAGYCYSYSNIYVDNQVIYTRITKIELL